MREEITHTVNRPEELGEELLHLVPVVGMLHASVEVAAGILPASEPGFPARRGERF